MLQLTAVQQLQYARIADEMNASGFDTEPFGHRTIAVKAAPAGVTPAEIEKLVFEILEIAEEELRRISLDDIRRAIAASIACRAAIKVNMKLDNTKMEWLLASLAPDWSRFIAAIILFLRASPLTLSFWTRLRRSCKTDAARAFYTLARVTFALTFPTTWHRPHCRPPTAA